MGRLLLAEKLCEVWGMQPSEDLIWFGDTRRKCPKEVRSSMATWKRLKRKEAVKVPQKVAIAAFRQVEPLFLGRLLPARTFGLGVAAREPSAQGKSKCLVGEGLDGAVAKRKN